MSKFIRLDMKGHWRSTDHKSSIAYYGEGEQKFEKGISCYHANLEGIEELYKYWTEYASLSRNDYENMQLTIFEGDFVGHGACGEELATCNKTIQIKEAKPFLLAIEKLKDTLDGYEVDENGDEIEMTQEEYEEKLANLLD